MTLSAEGEARLRRRWARVTADGGAFYDALIEYRKSAEADARSTLLGVMTHERPPDELQLFVREANRDLCGSRFGQAFLLHLPQMAWLRNDPALIAGRLAEQSPDKPDPSRLLSAVETKRVFNFLTLVLYILAPELYYPWIRRIHDAVRELFELPKRAPTLSVDDYLQFCSLLRSMAARLEFSPQALDYLLFDLAEKPGAARTRKAPRVAAQVTPITAANGATKTRRERSGKPLDDLGKVAAELWWEGKPVRPDRTADNADEPSWFGRPLASSELPRPEKFDGPSRKGELRRTLVGYKTLDQRSGGRYSSFLRDGAGCTRCASDMSIQAQQQPIPLLCGSHDFSQPVETLEKRLVQRTTI